VADTSLPVAPDSADAEIPSALEILRRFRHEKTDPEPFYVGLASRTFSAFPHPVQDRQILDLGCGPGWYSKAMEQAGAKVVGLDLGAADVHKAGENGVAAMVGDGMNLPFADATFDGVFCSNLLEHVPDPMAVVDEIARVCKPGAWAWISWTPWYSPWGGHEIVPLHLLGPSLGPKLWERWFGVPRSNVPFDGLWPTYVGAVTKAVKADDRFDVESIHPRYYPFLKPIMSVPGLREFASWNCVIDVVRRAN
jgi:SAM-dependent methyltransferase